MHNIDRENILNNIPNLPGVYLFKNSSNTIIYIGKAKDLKKRVSNYFKNKNDSNDYKIEDLLREFSYIDYIITGNENEALLLEAILVQKFQPKYNILLKAGTPFVFIEIISKKNSIPKLVLSRKFYNNLFLLNNKNKQIFGPFLANSKIRSVYNYLIKIFRLKLCNKKIENGCLDYHLGICAGSCVSNFDLESYKIRLAIVKELLNNNLDLSKELLIDQINKYNNALEFEKSKLLSNYLRDLDYISENLKNKFSEDKYSTQIFLKTNPKEKVTSILNALKELKDLLNLDTEPINIDCFDISHFQGNYIVGSCIRFSYGFPDKSKFRKFKVKTLNNQDDYMALQEIVKRRYKNSQDLPNLILIDGGKGQLNAVNFVINNNDFIAKDNKNKNIACISLAKKEEILFFYNFDKNNNRLQNSLKLDWQKDYAKLLISLRDYAHHFAITYHKNIRDNNFII